MSVSLSWCSPRFVGLVLEFGEEVPSYVSKIKCECVCVMFLCNRARSRALLVGGWLAVWLVGWLTGWSLVPMVAGCRPE